VVRAHIYSSAISNPGLAFAIGVSAACPERSLAKRASRPPTRRRRAEYGYSPNDVKDEFPRRTLLKLFSK